MGQEGEQHRDGWVPRDVLPWLRNSWWAGLTLPGGIILLAVLLNLLPRNRAPRNSGQVTPAGSRPPTGVNHAEPGQATTPIREQTEVPRQIRAVRLRRGTPPFVSGYRSTVSGSNAATDARDRLVSPGQPGELLDGDERPPWPPPPGQGQHGPAHREDETTAAYGEYNFVVVANRLPVDRDEDGEWRTSPGGLVSALAPVMAAAARVGWSGAPGPAPDPFDKAGMRLVSVALSDEEIRDYYEGFSNGTLWPLYHDVIAPPEFHRPWWEAYVRINRRFAETAARQATEGATVWVHDYQLQLVPQLLREIRPDLRIGWFDHIPFPGYEILPRCRGGGRSSEGCSGPTSWASSARATPPTSCALPPGAGWPPRLADPGADASSTTRPRTTPRRASAPRVAQEHCQSAWSGQRRSPSRSTPRLRGAARRDDVRARSVELREALGNPAVVLLGVDRLDYTKGILHRLKAYGEVLADGRLTAAGRCWCRSRAPAESASSSTRCCATRSR